MLDNKEIAADDQYWLNNFIGWRRDFNRAERLKCSFSHSVNVVKPVLLLTNSLVRESLLTVSLLIMLCLPHTGNAVSEADVFSEIPIITAATRLEQKTEDSPASITILTKELIQASGIQEISQLFNLVPGFYSFHDFAQTPATTRGLAYLMPGDIEIILDGRSIYEADQFSVEWVSLGIGVEDIEYIEVVRGSNAPAYGSNASLGAINIVTTSPLEAQGTQLTLTGGDGDYNARNANFRHHFSLANTEWLLGVNYRKNDGFPSFQSSPPEPAFDQIKDGSETLHIRLRGLYTPDLDNTFEIQLGAGDTDLTEPAGGGVADPRGFENKEFKRSHQLLRWHHQFTESDWQTTVYHNRLEVWERIEFGRLSERLGLSPATVQTLLGHPDDPLSFGAKNGLSERYDVETQYRTASANQQRLVLGAGIRYSRVRNSRLLDRTDALDEWRYRAFINWECKATAWLLINAGLMAEKSELIGTHYSPRLGINFRLWPDHTLRFNVTRSSRIPSLLDTNLMVAARFPDGTLIDTLEMPEDQISETRVLEYEVGYLARLFDDRVQADIRLFKTDVNGAISQRRELLPTDLLNPRVLIAGNFTDFNIEGVELQVTARPDDHSLINLAYSRNRFTGTRIRGFNPFRTRDLINQLPRDNLSLMLKRTLLPGLDASLTWYHWSESKPFQGDFVDDHNRLDVRLAKTFKVNNTSAVIELLVHNIGNENYTDFTTENLYERRILGKLTLNF